MAAFKDFFANIKLTYRRSSNLTKVIVTVAIVLCTATLITLRLSVMALEDRTEDLRNQAGVLEEENRELNEKIGEIGSVKSVVEIAEEELDLVQPGAVIIKQEP